MKKENDIGQADPIKDVLLPYFIIAVIFSPIIGWILIKKKGFNFSDLGSFGDFLAGSTVPFLTIITILLLIRTINIQNNQLEVQKNEFSLLTNELESTKEALQEQGKTARIQRFENSFYLQINELRDIKGKIVKEYNSQRGVRFQTRLSYKDIMEYIDGEIELRVSANMTTILSQSKMEKNSSYYFHNYGKMYEKAYSHIIEAEDSLEILPTYHFIIERIVILIFHHKNVMDEWELNYYKDYLYEEITREGINIVLFHLVLMSKEKKKVKELELDDYLSVNGGNHKLLGKLFDFLLNGSPDWQDWQNKKAKE